MAPWQSAELEANGLRLHYTRTGGDKPPLVLAHGFSDDGLCWTPVARALEDDYDMIMIEARGHGQSQAAEQNYSDVDLGNDLAGAIAALGLRRPAVLGHSMGAATALALAGAHPRSECRQASTPGKVWNIERLGRRVCTIGSPSSNARRARS